MPNYLHRTTKQLLRSVSETELPEAEANYIIEPDLSAVTGQPNKYWTITGDVVTLMDQAERDAVDAAQEQAAKDAVADEIDQLESYTRAFALAVLDEFNATSDKINELLDALDASTNLNDMKQRVAAINDRPQRSIAQLKTAIRSKL